ncbi:MAG TPA: hypothetical protein VER11_07410 [Polyangiaceae bacterium]|nr:hypothetical protein [Polyangiaceae bacterium]
MKFGVIALGTMGLLGLSSAALAQAETPKARTGFQMDIRTGYSVPLGSYQNGLKLSDVSSGQVPILLDIGAKVIPELFVGGYFGLSFGGAGGAAKDACNAQSADCVTVGFSFGAEAQYHILPAGLANPWVGYGLGFQSLGLGRSIGGNSTTTTATGFEFARFMGGVDFRVSRVFGVGPFVDFSMASFSSLSVGSASVGIDETATHEWLTLGARFVFFP